MRTEFGQNHGFVNKHNIRYQAHSNLTQLTSVSVAQQQSYGMFCSSYGIIGIYFIEDEDGLTTSLIVLICSYPGNFCCAKVQTFKQIIDNFWFQQDESMSYTAQISMVVECQLFGRCIILRNSNITLSLRSPDLTAYYFSLQWKN